jgi:hypothetical protein
VAARKITDLTVLNALLDAGKTSLSISENKAFSSMLDGLEAGQYINLSKGQREWALKRYYELGMDRAYINKAPPTRVPNIKRKVSTPIWEQPRPARPPGR